MFVLSCEIHYCSTVVRYPWKRVGVMSLNVHGLADVFIKNLSC